MKGQPPCIAYQPHRWVKTSTGKSVRNERGRLVPLGLTEVTTECATCGRVASHELREPRGVLLAQ